MNKKILFNIAFIFIIILILGNDTFAKDPTLVNKLNTAFKKITKYLVKLATPAAGVAIASGVMIRKLSFGDEQKMIMGKKIIINAIIGYAIIISIDIIIKFIEDVI